MTELNLDHPAVEAVARELAQLDDGDPWPSNDELGGNHILGTRDDEYRFAMLEEARSVLTTAFPHLMADLRNTEAGGQLLREGQAQGWSECADHVALHAVGLGHTMLSKNPYKMEEK